MDQLVESIWASVSGIVSGKLDESNLIILVPHIIAHIEKCKKDETGAWKRALCVSVVRLGMEKNGFSAEQTSNVLCVIGSVVDTLILVAKKKVDIGKTVRKCCFGTS